LSRAAYGDTIQVGSGTYREKLFIIDQRNVTISGAGRNQTRIVGRYRPSNDVPAVFVERSTGINISGIGFEGGHTGIVVTKNSDVRVESSFIRDFHNVGIFIGAIPCSPLPPGSLKVPQCYKNNRQRYVDYSRLEIYNSTVEANGVKAKTGTGLVYFPGTSGRVQGSTISQNKLTGIFVWGAQVDISQSVFKRNIEHALEYRKYPSPKTNKGFTLRAGGVLTGNELKTSKPLWGSYLGGGLVTQAADLELYGNLIEDNAAWGISACKKSNLILGGNTIINNGKAGIIVQKKTQAAFEEGNTISGNRHEGLVAQGNTYVTMVSSIIQYNGRCGALIQKKSEVHLDDVLVRGNGTQAGYFSGLVFTRRAWGSVNDSDIRNHQNGAGIHYYGGPYELSVEYSEIAGNKSSGVVFEGTNARGDVYGNVFSGGNSPYDVNCPNGGNPSLGGHQGAKINKNCR
jgi:parallel beta-helix repeat protein